MPVSGLNHGHLASRDPPLQDMAFRPVQVVPKALEVAEQQFLAQRDKTKLADYSFLDFKHVLAFLKFTAACSAFDVLDLHWLGEDESPQEC